MSGNETTVATDPPATAEPGRGPRRKALAVLFAAAPVVLLIDIVTKQLAVGNLEGEPSLRLLGGAVYLLLVRNSGAAFSLGTGYTFVFPLITLAVVAWIGWTA